MAEASAEMSLQMLPESPHVNGLKPIENKVSETRHGYTVSQIKPHCSNMSNEFPFQCMICMVIGLNFFY